MNIPQWLQKTINFFGYELHENEELVQCAINGLENNKQKTGTRYCPCEFEQTLKTVCPCENMRKLNKCKCCLFKSKE